MMKYILICNLNSRKFLNTELFSYLNVDFFFFLSIYPTQEFWIEVEFLRTYLYQTIKQFNPKFMNLFAKYPFWFMSGKMFFFFFTFHHGECNIDDQIKYVDERGWLCVLEKNNIINLKKIDFLLHAF